MKRNKIRLIAVSSALIVGASVFIAGCSSDKKINNQEITAEKSKEKSTENNASDVNFEKFVSGVHENIKAHWPHMDKVWPTYDYKNHNFILLKLNDDQSISEAWVMNSNEKRKLKESEYGKITAPQPGGYSELKFEGKPSIAMSVDDSTMDEKDSVNEIYRIGTHELVHFYYQKLSNSDSEADRSQKYPSDGTPRIYRRMIYDNLIKAYEEPDKDEEYLSKAKYWLDKWKTEYEDEYKAIKSTDIAEGTARYSENLSMFITDKISDEEFRTSAIKEIKRPESFDTADEESYEIGYVAALILDKKQPDWKEKFYEEGKTIEEKLLENTKPTEEEADAERKDKITKSTEAFNSKVKENLKDIIKAEEDKNIPYLKINVTEASSSFKSEGMVLYKDNQVLPNYINNYKVDGNSLNINKVSVLDEVDEDQLYVLLPLTMEHEYKDGKLKIDSETIKADSIKAEKSEENGRVIYKVTAK